MGSNGTPARAATAAPLLRSAARSTSTQARVIGRRGALSCEERTRYEREESDARKGGTARDTRADEGSAPSLRLGCGTDARVAAPVSARGSVRGGRRDP